VENDYRIVYALSFGFFLAFTAIVCIVIDIWFLLGVGVSQLVALVVAASGLNQNGLSFH